MPGCCTKSTLGQTRGKHGGMRGNHSRLRDLHLPMNSIPRRFALSLALAAMLMGGLLPAGWMPAADGSARLVICPGHGAMHMAPAPHRGHTVPDRADQVCPFAMAVHHAPPVAYQALLAPAKLFWRIAQIAALPPVAAARPPGTAGPRAPPVLA